jgi:hypothetical protein
MITQRETSPFQPLFGPRAVAMDVQIRLLAARIFAELLAWTTRRLRANSLTHLEGEKGGLNDASVSD